MLILFSYDSIIDLTQLLSKNAGQRYKYFVKLPINQDFF